MLRWGQAKEAALHVGEGRCVLRCCILWRGSCKRWMQSCCMLRWAQAKEASLRHMLRWAQTKDAALLHAACCGGGAGEGDCAPGKPRGPLPPSNSAKIAGVGGADPPHAPHPAPLATPSPKPLRAF
jgi:hypothetical protein